MTKLNLTAETQPEQIILAYLEQNASDTLAEKINTGKKTMKQCYAFIKGEAKKQAKNGCAAIEDRVVFGWAVHFFEEDGIEAKADEEPKTTNAEAEREAEEEPKKAERVIVPKKPRIPETPKQEPKKNSGELAGQMDIFSFLEG